MYSDTKAKVIQLLSDSLGISFIDAIKFSNEKRCSPFAEWWEQGMYGAVSGGCSRDEYYNLRRALGVGH